MRIVWSPLALVRVEEIARVIAADRPAAAERWVRTVFARAAQLRTYPESGRLVPELARPELRQLPHPPYRIIYRIYPDRIDILAVIHAARLLPPNLNDLPEKRTNRESNRHAIPKCWEPITAFE